MALTMFAVLTLAIGSTAGLALAAATWDIPVSAVTDAARDGGTTVPALAALVVAECVLALVVGALLVATIGWRSAGFGISGTTAALRRCLPLLAVVVGLPLVAGLATGADLVAEQVDLVRGAWLVALAFAVGIAEEIVFRGGVVRVLGGRAAPLLAAGGSAALFGVLHLGSGGIANPIAVALIVGVPFALVRMSGGSVLGLAIAHGIIDVYALLQLGSAQLPDQVSAASQLTQILVACAVCAGYVVWYRGRSSSASQPAPAAPTSD